MVVAAVWLAEPISGNQVAGAGAIFAGLLITRFVH
jgi:drug/metabolite transporter (DMT)-like permease